MSCLLRLIIILRTGSDLASYRFSGGLLRTVTFVCIGFFIFRLLFIVAVTEAKRVVFANRRRVDGGQRLPFAGLASGGWCALSGFWSIVKIVNFFWWTLLERDLTPIWRRRRGLE